MEKIKQETSKSYFYVIDHEYIAGDTQYCITEIKPDKLEKILASIDFLSEEVIDQSFCMINSDAMDILEKFYQVKKSNPLEGITFDNYYDINRYVAREKNCGPNYQELMKKYLPEGEDYNRLKEAIADIVKYYS